MAVMTSLLLVALLEKTVNAPRYIKPVFSMEPSWRNVGWWTFTWCSLFNFQRRPNYNARWQPTPLLTTGIPSYNIIAISWLAIVTITIVNHIPSKDIYCSMHRQIPKERPGQEYAKAIRHFDVWKQHVAFVEQHCNMSTAAPQNLQPSGGED